MTRRRISTLRWAVLTAAAAVASMFIGPAVITTSAAPPAQTAQAGDSVIPNHDFSDGLTDWSTAWTKRGHSIVPAAQCSLAATVEGEGSTQAMRLTSVAECARPAVLSGTVAITPGTLYTAWISASETERGTEVGLRFTDASGSEVGVTWTRMRPGSSPEMLRVEAIAPRSADQVGVVLSARTTAVYDDVLLSAQMTDLDTQLSVPSSANGTAYSTDGQGHDMSYSVMVGAHGVDARLAGIRLDNRTLALNIPIPGAMGAWNAHAVEDGTVYIGSYNYADGNIGGRLFSYTPGADAVVDLGTPAPGDTFLYGVNAGPDGSIIGGTYPSGSLWRYSPDSGFATIGPQPILPGIQYVRSVGYDPVTDLVFAGTAGTAHIVACHADGSGECAEILPASYSGYPWVYNMAAGEGRVFARVTDDHGDDHLVVLKPTVATDGAITAVVENDIAGLSFPGTTSPVDGAVYYAKAGKLFRYNISAAAETDLGVNTTIFARQWAVRRMVDQTMFPGDTVVGVNSRGAIATYGIQDGNLRVGTVDNLPLGVADIEKIVGGPDGRIYASGYLIGGLSSYEPLLGQAPQQFSSSLDYGQSEGMTVLGDRVYLGIYPGAEIRSFNPATVETPSRLDCQIGAQQDRPYTMLGAPNGRIYAGTMAIYGQLSGALTEYDPSTGECTPYRDIVPNQSIVSAAWAKDRVVAGSLVWGGLGVPATETEAKLAVFDPTTKESHTVDLPVRGLRSITAMATDNNETVWLIAQNYLMAFDTRTERFTKVSQIYPELTYRDDGRISAYDSQLATSPDGRIFGAIRGRLFELDVSSGTVIPIATGSYSHVTFDGYGNVYSVTGANRLFRYVPPTKR